MNSINPGNMLVDRERIRGASRMIAEGTDAASVSPDKITQIAADVEIFRRAQKIPRTKIARTLGYSESVISEFLQGKYKGNNGQVAIDLDAWLDGEQERLDRPATTQFVMTNVALEIKATAAYCMDKKKIGLVFGPETSGMGKTTALQAIHQILGPRQSALVTIDKVDANPTGLLKKLLQSMHMDDKGSNKQRFDRLVEKIAGVKREKDRKFIFLIDQIHNLRESRHHKPFYILADLFDATQAAQLWVGTSHLVKYLKQQETRAHDESLAQIRRRIYPIIDLVEALSQPEYGGNGGPMCVTVDQVREIFAKSKLRLTTSAARFLCQICNLPDSGSVGLATNIMEFAVEHAELRGMKSVDVDLLKYAMGKGLTTDRADTLVKTIASFEATPMSRIA